MPLMLPAQDLLEPVDDASGVELPRHLADSLEHLRAAVSRCDRVGIPSDTLIAAPMTDSLEHLRAAVSRCDRVGIPSDTLIAAPMTELKTPTFRLRSDLDCRTVQRNPFSSLSRQSKVPRRTSGLGLAV